MVSEYLLNKNDIRTICYLKDIDKLGLKEDDIVHLIKGYNDEVGSILRVMDMFNIKDINKYNLLEKCFKFNSFYEDVYRNFRIEDKKIGDGKIRSIKV